ncbi:hypothetical protein EDC01DRAFT_676074 [Geopyxis carbonaria]|nr:hypothetical protein EDC01DRAFT_676074 [Geopyxis carbonaria]
MVFTGVSVVLPRVPPILPLVAKTLPRMDPLVWVLLPLMLLGVTMAPSSLVIRSSRWRGILFRRHRLAIKRLSGALTLRVAHVFSLAFNNLLLPYFRHALVRWTRVSFLAWASYLRVAWVDPRGSVCLVVAWFVCW